MQLLDFKKNYFDLFDIRIGFDIDENLLRDRQRQLQSLFHPDRFVTANEQDKRLSVQQAAWVNEAGAILLNPVKRAQYLLELSGLGQHDENETTSDPVFLMEQIEQREQLDACRNDADPLSRCDQIASNLNRRAQQLAEEFTHYFKSRDLQAARKVCQKMQFIQSIQTQLAERQFELEAVGS